MKTLASLFVLTITFAVCNRASGKNVSHCVYGTTLRDLLKLAGIRRGNIQSHARKLQQHNVDQSVLCKLTLQQLKDIGIAPIGDRLKIFNFFSKDGNDCSSSSCQNNGICRDGFRCFSCVCDPKKGYYGPSCGQKCPCHNGGVCKTKPTGFECVCPPGNSGDLCKTKYLTEDRIVNIETRANELKARLDQCEQLINNLQNQVTDLQSRPTGSWQLYRANEVLNKLEKIDQSHQQPATYTQTIPITLPNNTRAIIISIFCNYQNHNGDAALFYVTYQKGNDNATAKAEGKERHWNVHANAFVYEQMIPWNPTLPNELIFKVIWSKFRGGIYNWYRVRLVGYITSP
ncbi:uncharacterized protein LOC114515871 [Dendronephthya gigantea]|uniref:uncharacterized protein LOC114515871 n=1 Tax=Dendronephthya gigantea TaxID=151771 RepID=UPI00106A0F69|nr:uncharacterized protein LOC114515871 [Dendronephthya gigantea]